MATTHFSSLQGKIRATSGANSQPSPANAGDLWYNTTHATLMVYDGSAWRGIGLTSTSTSTSSSTSTSTTTT